MTSSFVDWLKCYLPQRVLEIREGNRNESWSFVAVGAVTDDSGWELAGLEMGSEPSCPGYWPEVPFNQLIQPLLDLSA